MFEGYTELAQAKIVPALIRNASGVPIDADALPTFRVYGRNGLLESGTCSRLDSGTITGATNASPIVITSANHGLNTGTLVTISGVTGNTAANGKWVVTRINASTFSLDSSVGNGAYVSGGVWSVTGLYSASITPQSAAGYEQGESYTILVSANVSGVAWAETYTFVVS